MYFSQLSGKVIDVACCFDKIIDDTFYMGAHYHPRVEIMYCLNGEFDLEIFDDLNANTVPVLYHFPPRTFVMLNPNVTHNLIVRKGKEVRMLNIEFTLSSVSQDIAHKVFYLNGENLLHVHSNLKAFSENKKPFFVLTDNAAFGKRLKEYIELAGTPAPSNEQRLELQLLLYQAILEFGKCYENTNKTKIGVKYVKLAVDFIEKNYTKKLTVEEIAAASGINKFYLQKLFQQYLQKSILNVLNSYRIERCKQLLASSNVPLKNLYAAVGFSSRQAMLYEFKKATGSSPSEYKKNNESRSTDIRPSKKDFDSTVEVKPAKITLPPPVKKKS